MKYRNILLSAVLILFALSMAACGGDEEPTTEAPAADNTSVAEEVTPTETPPPPTEEPSPEVTNLQDVKTAVVQIVAQGTFRDPAEGFQYNTAGAGTGFIIDPEGIAVTNNHVVTGAAFLQVYVDGEDSPRNARVLGVSECSDLAVIDIDGNGYPYLEWFDGSIDVGLDVYTAGFPLGDPEYTLTRGIISKARADGETSWASVDSVLEHDATINPGNSGGPLVTADGQVVGVNYAGASSVNQYFAIARDEAVSIIERLRNGENVTSIGINGTAVSSENLNGIWVSSVQSGSPADGAGIRAGDIIISMEGLLLAQDGTMSDYCDILRSRNATDVMRIEVLRFDTEELLEGQLNGNPLELSFSFAQEIASEVSSDNSGSGTAVSYNYVTITDNSGLLSVEVPSTWTDVDGGPWGEDPNDPLGVAVRAAPNLDSYFNSWGTPGVFFGASFSLVEGLSEAERRNLPDDVLDLDAFDYSGSCTLDSRREYSDPLYAGKYNLWTNCGDAEAVFIELAVLPEDLSFFILVDVQVITEADLEALDRILNSFIVSTN